MYKPGFASTTARPRRIFSKPNRTNVIYLGSTSSECDATTTKSSSNVSIEKMRKSVLDRLSSSRSDESVTADPTKPNTEERHYCPLLVLQNSNKNQQQVVDSNNSESNKNNDNNQNNNNDSNQNKRAIRIMEEQLRKVAGVNQNSPCLKQDGDERQEIQKNNPNTMIYESSSVVEEEDDEKNKKTPRKTGSLGLCHCADSHHDLLFDDDDHYDTNERKKNVIIMRCGQCELVLENNKMHDTNKNNKNNKNNRQVETEVPSDQGFVGDICALTEQGVPRLEQRKDNNVDALLLGCSNNDDERKPDTTTDTDDQQQQQTCIGISRTANNNNNTFFPLLCDWFSSKSIITTIINNNNNDIAVFCGLRRKNNNASNTTTATTDNNTSTIIDPNKVLSFDTVEQVIRKREVAQESVFMVENEIQRLKKEESKEPTTTMTPPHHQPMDIFLQRGTSSGATGLSNKPTNLNNATPASTPTPFAINEEESQGKYTVHSVSSSERWSCSTLTYDNDVNIKLSKCVRASKMAI